MQILNINIFYKKESISKLAKKNKVIRNYYKSIKPIKHPKTTMILFPNLFVNNKNNIISKRSFFIIKKII